MTATMPEPPDHRTLVGLFDPTGRSVPAVFERDNSDFASPDDGAHWFGPDGEPHTFVEVIAVAAAGYGGPREVVRLYRADDPAVTDAFNAGVKAAADAIKAEAESLGWHHVWADAIEQARKAAAN